jgi:hypothetical protein
MAMVMIEVNIPAGRSIAEAKMAVERHFSNDWIAEWWHIDDAIEQAESAHDEQLTKDEAREVLGMMEDQHDCNIGHSWETMDRYIEQVIQQREAV